MSETEWVNIGKTSNGLNIYYQVIEYDNDTSYIRIKRLNDNQVIVGLIDDIPMYKAKLLFDILVDIQQNERR